MHNREKNTFWSTLFLIAKCLLLPPGNTALLIWFCTGFCYYDITYYGVIPQALPSALSKSAADQLEFPQQQQLENKTVFPVISCKYKGKILLGKDDLFWQFIPDEVYILVTQIKSWIFSTVSSYHWRNMLHLPQPHLLCSPWLFVQSLFVRTVTSMCPAALICNLSVPLFVVLDVFNPKHIL